MQVVISLLRGVNLGGHNKVKMEELRALYSSLKLRDVQSYIQSGNVIFRTPQQDLASVCASIEGAIAKKFGIKTFVVLRTIAQMRNIVARNPFASEPGVEPNKLVVTFLPCEPGEQACNKARAIPIKPEVLHILGSELFIHFPNGQGQSKFPWPVLDRTLGTSGTSRNWNSVTKLLEMAEKLDANPHK